MAYVETVALRIMWGLGGSGAQRISLQRWRRSSLPDVLFQLDEEGDINLVRDFFSYNHFYVIWCLFWELDEDEDGQDKLPSFGPVAVHHQMQGDHTICCAACVSGRDPVFVEKLRRCLDEGDVFTGLLKRHLWSIIGKRGGTRQSRPRQGCPSKS